MDLRHFPPEDYNGIDARERARAQANVFLKDYLRGVRWDDERQCWLVFKRLTPETREDEEEILHHVTPRDDSEGEMQRARDIALLYHRGVKFEEVTRTWVGFRLADGCEVEFGRFSEEFQESALESIKGICWDAQRHAWHCAAKGPDGKRLQFNLPKCETEADVARTRLAGVAWIQAQRECPGAEVPPLEGVSKRRRIKP